MVAGDLLTLVSFHKRPVGHNFGHSHVATRTLLGRLGKLVALPMREAIAPLPDAKLLHELAFVRSVAWTKQDVINRPYGPTRMVKQSNDAAA